MKSWKTTLAGVSAIVTTLTSVVTLMTDGNPATNPDWSVVVPSLIAAFGLLFARDNKVTSEQAGAK